MGKLSRYIRPYGGYILLTMVIKLLDENDKPIESRTLKFSVADLDDDLDVNVAEFWLRAK